MIAINEYEFVALNKQSDKRRKGSVKKVKNLKTLIS